MKFSLRTFLLVVAFLCMWISYYVKWANDRKNAILNENIGTVIHYKPNSVNEVVQPTPAIWSLLGFKYYDEIYLSRSHHTVEDLHRYQRIFPEAKVTFPFPKVVCPICKIEYDFQRDEFRKQDSYECDSCGTILAIPVVDRFNP